MEKMKTNIFVKLYIGYANWKIRRMRKKTYKNLKQTEYCVLMAMYDNGGADPTTNGFFIDMLKKTRLNLAKFKNESYYSEDLIGING